MIDLTDPMAPLLVLGEKLREAGLPVLHVEGGNGQASVTYMEGVTQAQRDQGAAIVAAFDWTLAAEKAAAATATANEQTIGQQVDAALLANAQAIAQLVAWRTMGPGAGTANLTAAQQSLAARQTADHLIALFRQNNGLVRLVRKQLATADLSAAGKVSV